MEKWLCIGAMVVAGVVLLVYLLDLVMWGGSMAPFGTYSMTQDIVFIICAGLILWQGIETYKEVA